MQNSKTTILIVIIEIIQKLFVYKFVNFLEFLLVMLVITSCWIFTQLNWRIEIPAYDKFKLLFFVKEYYILNIIFLIQFKY